jgi:hypothetical protein
MLAKFGDTYVEYKLKTGIEPYVVHFSTWDEESAKNGKGKSRPTRDGAPLMRPGKDKILGGLPDVYRYRGINGNKEPEYIELTQDRQHYLLYINITKYLDVRWTKQEYYSWFNTKSALVKWAAKQMSSALTHDRSHTNFLGINNSKNYLTGDLDREGLPKFSKIVTGRARLKLYNGKREIKNIPGVGACIAFHALNASGDVWKFNWWDNPELFDRPCITGRDVRFDSKGSPYIYRDDLHYPYDDFSKSLIFPMWLPNTDKGFVLETLTRPLLSGESLDKFG